MLSTLTPLKFLYIKSTMARPTVASAAATVITKTANICPTKSLGVTYLENATTQQQLPSEVIPPLLPHSRPVHEEVKVDVHIPGCPPHADLIFGVLEDLLNQRVPVRARTAKFG